MRIWIAAALVLGALVALSAQAPAAKTKERNGRISFWGDRNPIRPSIYTLNPDGTGVRDLGRGMHSSKRAQWSPDGRLVAFDGRDYVTLFDFDIFVARADGSGRRKITRGPARDLMPSWSPDGRWIAFSRSYSEMGVPEIWIVGSDGTRARRLTKDGIFPAWSPDGRTIAFSSIASVEVIRADGTGRRKVAAGEGPSWSPDGRRLAFTRNGDVWTMQADGSRPRRLTRSRSEDIAADWSPDGRFILFTSDRAGSRDVFVMRPDSSGVRRITRHPADEDATSWQPLVG